MPTSIECTTVRITFCTHLRSAAADVHIGLEYGIHRRRAGIDKVGESVPILNTLDAEEILHHQRNALAVLHCPAVTQL